MDAIAQLAEVCSPPQVRFIEQNHIGKIHEEGLNHGRRICQPRRFNDQVIKLVLPFIRLPIMGIKSLRPVQQMQPLFISKISGSVLTTN